MATRPTKSSLALVNPIPPEVPKMPSSVFPPPPCTTRHHHISHPISPRIALGELLTSITSLRGEEAQISWQSSCRSAEIVLSRADISQSNITTSEPCPHPNPLSSRNANIVRHHRTIFPTPQCGELTFLALLAFESNNANV